VASLPVLDAGRIFNEFPLMGGRSSRWLRQRHGIPELVREPDCRQFNHRVLAVLLALSVWLTWLIRGAEVGGQLRGGCASRRQWR
jgi:hypothetical protein